MRQQRLDLHDPRLPKQPEMGRHHAHRSTRQIEVRDKRAPRLKPRQRDLAQFPHHALSHEDEISVPSVSPVAAGHRHRNEAGNPRNPVEIEQGRAVAETPVCLLKRDHVRADLGNDFRSPFRHAATIGTDAFVDIVGGKDRFAARCFLHDCLRSPQNLVVSRRH